MYLSRLTLRNFRQFGDGDDELDIALSSGVTALVGRNDCGKSAVIDAIRYALLTRDQNYIRIQPEDFHIDESGQQASDIFIRCQLSDLNDEEKGAFAEYLSQQAIVAESGPVEVLERSVGRADRANQGAVAGPRTIQTDSEERPVTPPWRTRRLRAAWRPARWVG